jgi:hypothetical protein
MTYGETDTVSRSTALARLLVVGTACLFTACGSSAPAATAGGQPSKASASGPARNPGPAPVSVDACALLTKEEVGAAIGKPVIPVVESTGAAASCAYHDATHQPNKFLSLIVYVMTPDQARGAFEATKGGGRDQVAVAGVGDDAYWDSFLGLTVLKGRYEIGISVSDRDVDQLKVARTLAPKVLSRLP